MKKYLTPDVELVVYEVMDIITASGTKNNMNVSGATPDVDEVEDYAMFL